MFIKWRVYQRQKYHQKGDKYFMQPILVKSYRLTKKRFIEESEKLGFPVSESIDFWESAGADISRPKHKQVYRFESFASCLYVYYKDPQYILQRYQYWQYLHLTVKKLIEWGLTEADGAKILDDIDSILPEPCGENLEILKKALAEDGKTLDNAMSL